MKAYVIMCNDSVQSVVLDSEKRAREECGRLSMDYYKRNNFAGDGESYVEYSNRIIWHIVDAPLINPYEDLLDECISHLDYCGYGDDWERECSKDLRQRIDEYQRVHKS